MKGPTPKDPDARRRANKASTAAVLEQPPATKKAPALPTRLFPGGTVSPLTRQWWKVIWKSPMSGRWLESDIEGLYLVAVLRNDFFLKPTASLAAEIRQQETRFGLSPIDRRRLDWRIQGPVAEPEPSSEEVAVFPDGFDPRDVLRAVK